ncbi:MAG TPA: hypothetical protein VLV83_02480 [Acidobacteriota bacterium]|nr:hypothetical protein [Acidobacteriota bacterium]
MRRRIGFYRLTVGGGEREGAADLSAISDRRKMLETVARNSRVRRTYLPRERDNSQVLMGWPDAQRSRLMVGLGRTEDVGMLEQN